jgi:hypothetical protein
MELPDIRSRQALVHVSSEGARPVVVVRARGGFNQAFYQSTGKSSSRGGHWLPFDRITPWMGTTEWFNKARYTLREGNPSAPLWAKNEPLYRYGTTDMRELGRQLDAYLGTTGVEAIERRLLVRQFTYSATVLNDFLDHHRARLPPGWVMELVRRFSTVGV